jgi:hypothetical protein
MTTGGRAAGEHVRGSTGASGTAGLPSPGVLRRRRHFAWHLTFYVLVNVLLVVVWLVSGLTSDTWFFWPVFVLAGWGLLLDVHVWWAYGRPRRPGADRVFGP